MRAFRRTYDRPHDRGRRIDRCHASADQHKPHEAADTAAYISGGSARIVFTALDQEGVDVASTALDASSVDEHSETLEIS